MNPARVDEVGDGDRRTVDESFSAFYEREYARVVRLAYLLVGSGNDPEGLAQEAFSRVQPHFSTLHSPRAYTRAVVVNLARRVRQRAARERSLTEVLPTAPTEAADVIELLDVIDALPFRQRAVVILRYYDGLSESEIAEALGCRPGTVKSLSHRALNRLRKDLSR